MLIFYALRSTVPMLDMTALKAACNVPNVSYGPCNMFSTRAELMFLSDTKH